MADAEDYLDREDQENKTGSNVTDEPPLKYNITAMQTKSLTPSEEYSLKLRDILQQHNISTHAGRELTYLINSIVDSAVEASKADVIVPRIVFQDTLNAMLLAKNPVNLQAIKICQDGCRPLNGPGSQCIDCNKKSDGRETDENQKQDQREIRMLSLGETMARMIANEETLDLLQYPSKFQHDQKVYKDFFSGCVYQNLSKSDLCKNADLNIFYGLYIDSSYVNTPVSKNTHFTTVIHCLLIFNFERSLRYKLENTIQLGVITSSKSPDIHAYLDIILPDLERLSTR
ncbi:hypothetical protein V8B55DRAFT_1382746 [Mucor lusitanicus]|uniref:Uncharacterized protein n=2 Tax=Mucor circinelloides f. lusitanicus TaxID=29924 RepID=A0A168MZ51_MUCCL|nr:hypothetical protein FB192DRAFT_1339208 [Mucor lusitanicus]OAD05564.1 hypothetical protein MUCCIDRAFT_162244 [Mucor lusitanicus CBS 277.49]